MNYGYADYSKNTWYILDALPLGGKEEEKMIENVYPAQAMGSWIDGGYYIPGSFPYKYFDQDASSWGSTFSPGFRLQFLPGITLTNWYEYVPNTSTKFIGTSTNNTRLFSRGDPSKGIRLMNGAMELRALGGIKFF
jgi:hypothetical protein